MDIDAFRASLTGDEPPAGLGVTLQSLWWDAKGDWERAHECAQEDEADRQAAWVHAYLHRKEGDPANAAYWYRRAVQPVANGDLDAEWAAITAALLSPDAKNRPA